MTSPLFSFPPESYSAVYEGDGATSAKAVHHSPRETCEPSASPPTAPATPSPSLFGCFHCAFRNGIKVIRKDKHATKLKFSENTFKQYYYATPEASDEEGTLAGKVKQAIAKKRSANDIDGFFEKQKKKLKLKKKSSSVARSSSGAGGVAYITSNNDEGADASHLVKIEIYDLNRIKNVVPSEQWKLADVRVKYYADCEEDKHLQSARDVIFNITKLLASKQDCSNYFIDNDKSNKKYSD